MLPTPDAIRSAPVPDAGVPVVYRPRHGGGCHVNFHLLPGRCHYSDCIMVVMWSDSMSVKFIPLIAVAACLVACPTASDELRTSSERKQNAAADFEALMNVMLPLANRRLAIHGRVLPFGGTMSQNGKIDVPSVGWDGVQPGPEILFALYRRAFSKGAARGEYKATALVYEMRIIPPGKKHEEDAVAVALDHRDDNSVIVVFPRTCGSGLKVEQSFTVKGKREVFARRATHNNAMHQPSALVR